MLFFRNRSSNFVFGTSETLVGILVRRYKLSPTYQVNIPVRGLSYQRNCSYCRGKLSRNMSKALNRVYKKDYFSTQENEGITNLRKPRIKPIRSNNCDENFKNCVAYCTAESCNLDLLNSYFVNDSKNYSLGSLPKDATDVLYIKKTCTQGKEEADIFLFRRLGAFVGWNIDENEISTLRGIVRHYELQSYSANHLEEEFEEMNFMRTDKPTSLIEGDIFLNSKNSSEVETLEKYAFSNAMALSVKLAMWEIALDEFSDSMRECPEMLKTGRPIKLNRKQILRKIGELISLRHQIYLYSDLLTTPDFFWERDGLEKLYTKTCLYLEITKRTKIMNEKMNLCSELVEMLRSHLNERHSHRLEWMIIVLITVEVLFEVIRLL